MSQNFVNTMQSISNTAYTENGAISKVSTLDAVLDLFASGAASRSQDEMARLALIKAAYVADKELALRAFFWLGDIRGGAGERDMFKLALKFLASKDPAALKKIVKLIPEYTRWDYIYELVGTAAEAEVAQLIRNEHARCSTEKTTSLMYKWLHSTNTSSKESRRLGQWTAHVLGYTRNRQGFYHEYQRLLTRKRKELSAAVVETFMSAKKWDKIPYDQVPSKASLIYRKAFSRQDTDRYAQYINAVNTGEKKMNMSVTYPHEIVAQYSRDISWYNVVISKQAALEAAWVSIPDYIQGKGSVLPMLDLSGSMQQPIGSKNSLVEAMHVSLGMGLYCAEKLSGPFKNRVLAFSQTARFIDTAKYGMDLNERLAWLYKNSEVANTNLQSAFDLILKTAQHGKLSQDDMPAKLLIISDMEFDSATYGSKKTNLEEAREKFELAGYQLPEVIFWNVAARNTQFPAVKYDKGIALVSGYSPTLFTQLLEGKIETPYDHMLKVLNSARYNPVIAALNE